jgi:hypothetical protein
MNILQTRKDAREENPIQFRAKQKAKKEHAKDKILKMELDEYMVEKVNKKNRELVRKVEVNNFMTIGDKIKQNMEIEDQGLEALAKFASRPKQGQEYKTFKSKFL